MKRLILSVLLFGTVLALGAGCDSKEDEGLFTNESSSSNISNSGTALSNSATSSPRIGGVPVEN